MNNNWKDLWIETYSEPSETYKMELFAKIVDCIQPLTIFEKHSILGVSQCYEHASDKTKQNPDALSFIWEKVELDGNFCNFFHFQIQFYLNIITLGETLLIPISINVSLISNWFTHAVEYTSH